MKIKGKVADGGAHQGRARAAATAPYSSLPVMGFTDEVNTWLCRVTGKMAMWFDLAGAARSRGREESGEGGGGDPTLLKRCSGEQRRREGLARGATRRKGGGVRRDSAQCRGGGGGFERPVEACQRWRRTAVGTGEGWPPTGGLELQYPPV
jgi:hypothetical protein